MYVDISSGAITIFLASIVPLSLLTRWVKTPHRVAHEVQAAAIATMDKRMSSMYDYLIPPRIKEIDRRDTPEI